MKNLHSYVYIKLVKLKPIYIGNDAICVDLKILGNETEIPMKYLTENGSSNVIGTKNDLKIAASFDSNLATAQKQNHKEPSRILTGT